VLSHQGLEEVGFFTENWAGISLMESIAFSVFDTQATGEGLNRSRAGF
jgi:hypothetical protein